MLVTDLAAAASADDVAVPLVVDIDGTLLRTDLLLESVFRLLGTHPRRAFPLLRRAGKGRAQLKAALAEQVTLDIDAMPLNAAAVAFVEEQRALGRRVYLASACDRRYAEAVAGRIGDCDGVFASDGSCNLKGPDKAALLLQAFGEGGFDYVGDARADLPVWRVARKAIMVRPAHDVLRAVSRQHPSPVVLEPRAFRPRDYLKAMRVHQWLKNTLLFLPVLAGHEITPENLLVLLVAFASFSLTASSIYIVNDLLDLGADRRHPQKRFRPLAAGTIPLSHGIALSAVLLAAGVALAALVSRDFLFVMLAYCVVTSLYSFELKRRIVVDVLTLAGLYTLRIFAGAAAVQIELSAWMLAFSMFLFLCLALVKRFTELNAQGEAGPGAGSRRSYLRGDAQLIITQACAAGYAAVVVLALYVNSPAVIELYTRPEGLWLVCVLLLYWLTRFLLIAHRGSMHHDPLVYALKDRTSLATIAATGAVLLGSSTL